MTKRLLRRILGWLDFRQRFAPIPTEAAAAILPPEAKTKARFNPLSYEEWRRREIARIDSEEEESDEQVTCPDCDGDCYIECDECGHEKECQTCDGMGTVDQSDLDPWDNSNLTRSAYLTAIIADAKAFADWTGQDFEVLWKEFKERIG